MSLGMLGKYTLLERLGEGGMGEVYRAASEGHSGFRRELAIKQMRELLSADPHHKELFLAEARSLAELRHRNIVQVFEFDIADGRPYLVMELLHGVSLAPFITQARLPIEGVCFVGAELADALAAVHKTGRASGQGGMVHGDLSPSNAMACVDGAVKLLDFGLATHELAARGVGPKAGKLPYLAPELLAGKDCDALTDVYALGVTLYELLAGARLFPGAEGVAARIARADYLPLSSVRPELPEEVRTWVERCLSRERSERPSAAQLAKALHKCHVGFGAGELARFVRQAQGGQSALEPTGTVPRVVAPVAVASDGPPTASALSVQTATAPRFRWWPIAGAVVGLVAVVAVWISVRSPEVVPVAPAVAPVVVAPEPVVVPEPVAPVLELTRVSDPPPPVRAVKRPPKKKVSKAPAAAPDRLAPGFIAEPRK